jgi:hypothetical protein
LVPFRGRLAQLAFASLLATLPSACAYDERSQFVGVGGGGGDAKPPGSSGAGSLSTTCTTPETGCACEEEGSTVECGEVTRRSGDYVACSQGVRTCSGGTWGECIGDQFLADTLKQVPSVGSHTLGLATSASPCVNNPCDPYCLNYEDTPAGFNAGARFTNNAAGLTSIPAPAPTTCTGLSITPATKTITVTSLSPLSTDTGNVTFAGQLVPAGCYAGVYKVLYDVDKGERSSITTAGVFSLLRPTAGPIRVTAYANGITATSSATVAVKVRDISSVSTAEGNKYWNAAGAPATTTLSTQVRWLYPYDNTVLPLGLLAPVLQWQKSGTATSIKVTLRYANGSSNFEYSVVVPEPSPDLRYVIPQAAWQGFEQTARGNNGTISLQRATASGLEAESTRTIRFADAQLKGTVYYNSYNSSFNGSEGAVLAIKPGASVPALAVPSQQGKCHVCHSLSADGGKLFFQNEDYDSASVYNPATGALLQSYDNAGTSEWGNRFDWGAIYPDGSMGLAHSKDGYHAFGDNSSLFPVKDSRTSGTAIPMSGFGSAVQAVTPAFSPDGRRLAFNFWAGTGANGVSQQGGKSLVSTDFSCGATAGSVTCTGSSSASNWRELIRAGSGSYSTYKYAGWPQFLPDSKGVLFNMFTRAPTAAAGSNLYTWQGAQAEIWLANSASVTPAPVRLNLLNGTGTIPGTSPGPAGLAPNAGSLHTTGNTVYWAGSGCGKSPTAFSGTVTEDQLNYMPTSAPQEAGGYYWVVFTSRRLYGNIAVNTPWEYEECINMTAPPAKKLWIAAIDKNWDTLASGVDPSHPAFYLPGQELNAGNMRGFWSKSPCLATGSTGSTNVCETDEDCCGGTSSPKTAACRVDAGSSPITRHCQAVVPNMCSAVGSSCSVDTDCCQLGNICISGVCRDALQYARQTFTRDYTASCPAGKRLVWRAFDWKASEVADDHIDFAVQTWSATGTPGTSVTIATAKSPSNPTTWKGVDVDAALVAAGQRSYANLRVSATFVPSSDSLNAPTLVAWRQNYDCLDNE